MLSGNRGHDLFGDPLREIEVTLDVFHIGNWHRADGYAEIAEHAEAVDDLLLALAGPRRGIVDRDMTLADAAGGHTVKNILKFAVVIRLRLDEIDAGGKVLGLRQERPPAGRIAGSAPENRVGVTAEPDRQVGFLDALWLERDVFEGHISPLEFGIFVGP